MDQLEKNVKVILIKRLEVLINKYSILGGAIFFSTNG